MGTRLFFLQQTAKTLTKAITDAEPGSGLPLASQRGGI